MHRSIGALIGATLDKKYQLLSLLGEGSTGSVYAAQHLGTLRHVALKLIKKDRLAEDRDAASRFRREARAVGPLDSPNVVQVLDSGEDQATGDLYLVMERLAGEDLQRLVDGVGPLPPDVALRVAGQALLGLSRAHAAGIVHRDLKPANLFLAHQADGAVTVKLLDFGLAKELSCSPDARTITLLTKTGGILGSPLYMSPEQVENSKDVDARTDVWSLACVLYYTLTGMAPHEHVETVGRLLVAICASPAPALRERAPWVSPKLARVVHDALAVDPARRTSSAAAMLEAIQPLAPDGFALRREMLVGLPAEEQGAGGRQLVAGPSRSILGDASVDTFDTQTGSAAATAALREVEAESAQAREPQVSQKDDRRQSEPPSARAAAPARSRRLPFAVVGAALVVGLGVLGYVWMHAPRGLFP
jgi:serine/threonine protein kinase